VSSFQHIHAAHCESGVTAALFTDLGHPLSEPMVFGIGGGVFFGHFSIVRVMGVPLTTFRSFPGGIFKNACARLGIRCRRERFWSPRAGMRRLDDLLEQGQRVGLQVNIFWLPYIPRPMRVHFNGHNLVVLEKRGTAYLISDPVMEEVRECPADRLVRARFSGGNRYLSRGLLYTPTRVPDTLELRTAIRKGLRQSCDHMLRIPRPLPWMGVRGVGHLADQIAAWPSRQGEETARAWLAGVVRMQEEIGTGGAGFRYLFAAFLQEAAETLGWSALAPLSEQATQVGDAWRGFALHASRRARNKPDRSWDQLAEMVREIGQAERALFEALDRVQRGGPPQLVAVPATDVPATDGTEAGDALPR